MKLVRIVAFLAGAAATYACATGGSLDGDDGPVSDTDAAAGAVGASGGSAPVAGGGAVGAGATGGTGATSVGGSGGGGTSGAGGEPTDAGADAAPDDGGSVPLGAEPCPDPGTKRCGGLCVPPTPALGCSLDDCTPCPGAPLNGFALCDGAACAFGCAEDFVATGGACEPAAPDGGVLPPACRDGLRNGGETDVDCGGTECGRCSDGEACGVGADCASKVCTGSACAAASCSDAVRNALETDVDCGGNCGATCQAGASCSGNADCARGPCVSGLCTCTPVCPASQCGTALADGCGGTIDCACPSGDVCFGGSCCSPITSCAAGKCGAIDDGCGGSFDCGGCSGGELCNSGVCCAPGACTPPEAGCVSASHGGHYYWFCSTSRTWRAARDRCMGVGFNLVTIDDAAENAFVDAQAAGTRWLGWTDANTPDKYSTEGTFVWQSGAPASYTNWNSGEPNDSSGEDCTEIGDGGGWNDIDCATESRAYVCEQALTTNSTTVAEGGTATLTCANGSIQGWTSMYGVGAGGSCPASCGSCTIGATSCSVTYTNAACGDCNNGTAKPGELRISCISLPCTNGVLDAGETDVDCGGPTCGGCPNGDSCSVGGDCASGRCDAGTCGSCTDGIKNGAEGGVDCGGGCPVTCGSNGLSCSVPGDCLSGFCVDGRCCNVACGAGAADCQACSVAAGGTTNGTCTFFAATTVCRSSGGACDTPETCTGSSGTCPTDAFLPAGTLCRSQTGICDAAELCSGSSSACPVNGYAAVNADCGYSPVFTAYATGAPSANALDFRQNFSSQTLTGGVAGPKGWADVLQFTSTTNSTSGLHHDYYIFSNATYVVQAGDFIEYDVNIASNVDGLGGIDIRDNSSATYWRDVPGWVGEEGVSGHPANSLAAFAFNTWHHRRLPVPAARVGATINRWDVVNENDAASTTSTAYYDNIVVTRVRGGCNGAGVCKIKTGGACAAASDCASGACSGSVCQ